MGSFFVSEESREANKGSVYFILLLLTAAGTDVLRALLSANILKKSLYSFFYNDFTGNNIQF